MSQTVRSTNATGLDDGVKIASDLIGTGTPPGSGEDVQYVKLDLGANGASAPVSGAVPVSGPLTDAQMRATAVPVSGPLTDAQMRASAVPTDVSDKDARVLGRVKIFDATGNVIDVAQKAQLPAALVGGRLDVNLGADAVGIAKDATLTGGTAKSIVRGGAKGVTGAADVTSTSSSGDHQGLDVVVCLSGGTGGPIDPRAIRALTSATDTVGIVGALPAGTNKIGTVDIATAAATAKNTQGANGVPTQDLKDAGRNTRVFMLDTITAAPVADALATVVQWYGNAAVAGTTQPAVIPAGKTLRLLTWKIQYQSLATVGYAVVRVRFNTAGLVVIGSPLVFSFEAGSGAGATTVAMTGGVTTETGCFPEGFELPAAGGIGFSVAGYGPTGTLTLEGGVRFMVCGYEY